MCTVYETLHPPGESPFTLKKIFFPLHVNILTTFALISYHASRKIRAHMQESLRYNPLIYYSTRSLFFLSVDTIHSKLFKKNTATAWMLTTTVAVISCSIQKFILKWFVYLFVPILIGLFESWGGGWPVSWQHGWLWRFMSRLPVLLVFFFIFLFLW